MEIVVHRIAPVNHGCLKALVDITINGAPINECRVVQQEGQRAFVQLPMFELPDAGGRTQYEPVYRGPRAKALRSDIQPAVLAAWDQYLEEFQ